MSSPNRCAHPVLAASVCLLAAAAAPQIALADGGLRWPEGGPTVSLETDSTPRWQGRIGVATQDAGDAAGWDSTGSRVGSLSLMGDYYFSRRTLGAAAGGFRATGGIVYGSRSPVWSGGLGSTSLSPGITAERRNYSLWGSPLAGDPLADSGDNDLLPYVGVGYTGLMGKRNLTGLGWGFSADLGLMALQPRSAVRFGQVVGGQQSLGEMVRDLQLNPMVHVGVSYAF